MDLLLPFSTVHRHEADFNPHDSLRESEQLIERQQLIQEVVFGDALADDLLDLLEFQGIDPEAYVTCVEANVEQVMRSDLIILPPY
jgi:hypothetical protein